MKGGENVQEIIKLIYQYLNMLKSQEIQQWVFDEINDLGKIKFAFKDKEKPINYVSSLTADMHIYEMDDLLAANYYLTKFDPEAIKKLYDYLTPDKMKLAVISKKFEGETDLTEKWYGTQYKVDKMSDKQLEEIKNCGTNENFSLPPKNTFIPSDMSLIRHDNIDELAAFPRIIHSCPLTRLWYKEDTKFLLPKAYIKFEIRNPLVYFDPVNLNMTNLFVELFRDSLVEFSYAADLAGLSYRVSPTNYGLNVLFSGFNDKMNVLLENLFEKMASFKVDPQRFKILKESVSVK